MTRHVIEHSESPDGERTYWECDCGQGGSCPAWKFEIHAESHVPEGEHVVYRYTSGDRP